MSEAARPLRSVARPKQARSEQTLQRLLDAAEALLVEEGRVDASVPEIARRAGSSVGGFYARFRDKDELFRALEERFFVDLYARLDALVRPGRWDGVPLGDVVRPCVHELVATYRRREVLIRCFLVRAGRAGEIFEDGLHFREQVSLRIGALLLSRRDEIAHPHPERAIDLAVQLAFALVTQAALLGELRLAGRRAEATELVDELTHCFLAYLGLEEGAGAPASQEETS